MSYTLKELPRFHVIVSGKGFVLLNTLTLINPLSERSAWEKHVGIRFDNDPNGYSEAKRAYESIGYRSILFRLAETNE